MKPERTKRSPRDDTARAAADRQAREIERLQRENDCLREQLDEQAKRIADLERQLALRQQNSTTTSKPPSSDGLAGRRRLRGRRVKSRRKAGGQPGHPGHHRELVLLERVDAVVDLVPETCRRCAHRLHARDDEGDPRRHQVTEVPPIARILPSIAVIGGTVRPAGHARWRPCPTSAPGSSARSSPR